MQRRIFSREYKLEAVKLVSRGLHTSPQLPDECKSALWIVLGDVIGDLFKIAFGFAGKLKDHADFRPKAVRATLRGTD